MQNQTVVQLPLESYRAIKKQFEVEIDVPPGLLPATWCSPAGGAAHCTAPQEGTSPAYHHITSLGSAKGKHSPVYPTSLGRTHCCNRGSQHPNTMAPCFPLYVVLLLFCFVFCFFFQQVLYHSVTPCMHILKELNHGVL